LCTQGGGRPCIAAANSRIWAASLGVHAALTRRLQSLHYPPHSCIRHACRVVLVLASTLPPGGLASRAFTMMPCPTLLLVPAVLTGVAANKYAGPGVVLSYGRYIRTWMGTWHANQPRCVLIVSSMHPAAVHLKHPAPPQTAPAANAAIVVLSVSMTGLHHLAVHPPCCCCCVQCFPYLHHSPALLPAPPQCCPFTQLLVDAVHSPPASHPIHRHQHTPPPLQRWQPLQPC
jgi:hypothetical protein